MLQVFGVHLSVVLLFQCGDVLVYCSLQVVCLLLDVAVWLVFVSEVESGTGMEWNARLMLDCVVGEML